MRRFSIEPAAAYVPDGLAPLAAEADSEGVRNVRAVIERWAEGSERFDRPGERLLVARADDRVIGVGGLSQCPTVPGALRMRRFYVNPTWRRRGVARALAEELIASGLAHAEVLTCNARASAAAPPFWEALGFDPVDIEGITHLRRRPARPGAADLTS